MEITGPKYYYLFLYNNLILCPNICLCIQAFDCRLSIKYIIFISRGGVQWITNGVVCIINILKHDSASTPYLLLVYSCMIQFILRTLRCQLPVEFDKSAATVNESKFEE